jgi:hypothetical protein
MGRAEVVFLGYRINRRGTCAHCTALEMATYKHTDSVYQFSSQPFFMLLTLSVCRPLTELCPLYFGCTTFHPGPGNQQSCMFHVWSIDAYAKLVIILTELVSLPRTMYPSKFVGGIGSGVYTTTVGHSLGPAAQLTTGEMFRPKDYFGP